MKKIKTGKDLKKAVKDIPDDAIIILQIDDTDEGTSIESEWPWVEFEQSDIEKTIVFKGYKGE